MMGYRQGSSTPLPGGASRQRSDWRVIKDLLPYLLEHRTRVALAIACLIAAKFANLGVPIVLKDLIDAMNLDPEKKSDALKHLEQRAAVDDDGRPRHERRGVGRQVHGEQRGCRHAHRRYRQLRRPHRLRGYQVVVR